MKKRYGFVSNSSSSSYTCQVCGEQGEYYDECPTIECTNGHEFCEEHLLPPPAKQQLSIKEKRAALLARVTGRGDAAEDQRVLLQHVSDARVEAVYEREIAQYEKDRDTDSPDRCPVCMMHSITDSDLRAWLLRKMNLTPEAAEQEIRAEFKTYADFRAFLRGKK